MSTATPNRWLVAVMGTLLQLCLGTVYAWSYFQKPLVTSFNWSNTQAAWAFSLAIFFIGFSAAWGGMNLDKYGPKKLAILGAALYGLGWILGGFALSRQSLVLLYLGYGIVGGSGLGLGYVTPVATVAKWFPDKKGLVTGMVIMGFGFGALVLSKVIAPYWYHSPYLRSYRRGIYAESAAGICATGLYAAGGNYCRAPTAADSDCRRLPQITTLYLYVADFFL